jgi:hypothetical protein
MKNYLIGLIIILFLLINAAKAENPFKYIKDINIETFFGLNSGSSYFDYSGKSNLLAYDSTQSDTVKKYLFEKRDFLFGLRAKYKLSKNILLTAEVPILYSNLIERFEADSFGIKYERADLSLTQPLYYSIGGIFNLLDGNFYTNFNIELRIPPKFYNGVNSNPDYNYLSDGAFESLLGLQAGIDFNESWIEGNLIYNFRDEDLVDQYKAMLEFGIKSIPDTYLAGRAEYVFSALPMAEKSQFNLRQLPLQEDYLNIGFSIYILIKDIIYTNFDISAKMAGTNTWIGGNYKLSVGLKL